MQIISHHITANYSIITQYWTISKHFVTVNKMENIRIESLPVLSFRKIHSPSISYSSYISGNRWNTWFYHSWRHSDTSGSRRSPEKRDAVRIKGLEAQNYLDPAAGPHVTHVKSGQAYLNAGVNVLVPNFTCILIHLNLCTDGEEYCCFSEVALV